ncbi:DUF732 domain-containing protein [Mycobacterium sp. CBMA293]|uniref:DUF732 domain-containing protein n=1 Tax=unclassified Mycolicibacterium TaxID=2636767 RepID=UPI0012DC0F30|nr:MULTISPECIES: DUF732 domain-containing protein [unclassified Mycolicibacterium]MUL45160.1 DUF732 domain-containing protein [Mycolicibacterium sp. CBMA 360]MUL56678.1 DUF732 domain-containing protein [Mycolicibacterium sp. CBMA 335]MUL69717.1 DUF732 domain-containing protein [Mycolicibacterium sp. CBMA 311]MUL91765.1 DUF732 domain-containing protein [Mycolicibacterium sp. CBMA 230]MUM05504.1 hypothetical protein [Mycolicibacterium sp. CBMA 213]
MRWSMIFMIPAMAIVIAAPVHADDGTQDEAFLLTLQNYRLHMDKNDAFAQGAAVCVVMNEGTSLASVGIQLMKMHPDWTLDDAGHFAGAAIQRYCPEQMPS